MLVVGTILVLSVFELVAASPTSDNNVLSTEPTSLNVITEEQYYKTFYRFFSGFWLSGNVFLYFDKNTNLKLYDVDTGANTKFIQKGNKKIDFVALIYKMEDVIGYSPLSRVTRGEDPLYNLYFDFVSDPSMTSIAYEKDNDIYYYTFGTMNKPQKINRNPFIIHGRYERTYIDEMIHSDNSFWFSGDGKMLAYVAFDVSDVVDDLGHYPVSRKYQYDVPKTISVKSPKPGTPNPKATVTLRHLESGYTADYTAPRELNEAILKSVCFITNDTIAIMWTNRGQTTFLVQTCTQWSDNCTEIFSYTEKNGWIEKMSYPLFNNKGDSFVILLPQPVNGVRYQQIVQVNKENSNKTWTLRPRIKIPHTVTEILLWTPDDIIWYTATHVNDSAEQHVYHVNAAGDVTCFSCGMERSYGASCLYNYAFISPDGTNLLLHCLGPDFPQVLLYNSNGTLLKVWNDNADLVANMSNMKMPETLRLSVPVAPGFPDAEVLIIAPKGYQHMTNVPLVVDASGPGGQVIKVWNKMPYYKRVNNLGIAMAFIDGRGTALRGVDNLFAIHRRLGTVEVDDHINVTRYLQKTLPWVDSNNTCIMGLYHGAFVAAHALARGGDVFKCGIIQAPIVDWRLHFSMYTERYMDTLQNNPEGYQRASLLNDQLVRMYKNKSLLILNFPTEYWEITIQNYMLLFNKLQENAIHFTQMVYYTTFDKFSFHYHKEMYNFLNESLNLINYKL